MNRSVSRLQLIGFLFTVAAGSLLHFLYGWTGGNRLAALFGSVNESTFEHMKLFFVPAFLYALFERRFFMNNRGYWCVKLRGILLGIVLIPVLLYTLDGCFGPTSDIVNIAIFFLSAGAAFLCETRRFAKDDETCKNAGGALLLLSVLAVLFAVFTFFPPKLPLFQDPLTGRYGIG